MTALYPLWFRWDGEHMTPLNPRAADRIYVVGETYRLDHVEERSTATHNHEFAWITEAWRTLPERLSDLYPTPERLRKRALIEAGFYDELAIDAGSNAAALRVAQGFRAIDDFALVIVRGPAVLMRRAKSQSRRTMNRQEFQASKTAIMQVIAELIGVSVEQLGKAEAA